jgi:hypothetical protein
MVSYMCFKFLIFDKHVLEKYVSQVDRGAYLLYSCLCLIRDNLFLEVRKMHPLKKSLVVNGL